MYSSIMFLYCVFLIFTPYDMWEVSMVQKRKIRKVFRSKPTLEGAGVHLHRVFANAEVPLFDPFLLLDDFSNTQGLEYIKGFPWHPHRGIETITYVLQGDIEHGDSLGNAGVISSGDMQWMTAGSGIIHQEMPKGDSRGVLKGFQLWANLPASHKMMDPRYRDIKNTQVPEVVTTEGAIVRVICGIVAGKKGPVTDVVSEPEYLDVTLPAGARLVHRIPRGHTAFAYVIRGKGIFCDENDPFAYGAQGENYFDMQRDAFIHKGSAVLFSDGDQVVVTAKSDMVRFLLVSGRPIREPVAWWGPIVMNTEAELKIAFEELDTGGFLKQASKVVAHK
jgi:redox-sensitive bicupin YhaK (pirin superfamily)